MATPRSARENDSCPLQYIPLDRHPEIDTEVVFGSTHSNNSVFKLPCGLLQDVWIQSGGALSLECAATSMTFAMTRLR